MTAIPPLPDDMRPVLHEFLAGCSTMALATAGAQDGRPQVTPLFFASDEAFNLYWISSPDSRHSANIAGWNDVAATIFVSTWDWARIKGVQIEGDAMPVPDDDGERGHALAVYKAKFPSVGETFAELIEESMIYVLRPRWFRWLDNAQHFGYRQEFSLEPPDRDARAG